MLKSVDELFVDVAIDFPGAGRPVILNELRKAARMFLNDSEVWREYAMAIDAAANQTEFVVSFPQHALVKRIITLYYGNPATIESSAISPEYFLIQSGGWLQIDNTYAPSAATAGYLLPYVVLIPARNGMEFPERFIETYADAIISKCKATMYQTPGVPWFAPQLAAFDVENYRVKLGEAKADVYHGGTRREVRCVTPFF
jgi:hypothetical protein